MNLLYCILSKRKSPKSIAASYLEIFISFITIFSRLFNINLDFIPYGSLLQFLIDWHIQTEDQVNLISVLVSGPTYLILQDTPAEVHLKFSLMHYFNLTYIAQK